MSALPVLFCQPTAGRSGSELSLLQILRSVDRERVRPFVLLGEDGPVRSLLEREAAEVLVVRAPKLRRDPRAALGFALSFPRLARTLRRLRRRHGLALVHVNTLMFPQAAVAARLAGLPVVTHVREVRTTYPPAVYDAYVRLALLLSRRIVCVCEHVLDQLLPRAGGRPRGARVVHNSSDFPSLEPRPLGRPARLVAVIPTTLKKGLLDLARALVLLHEREPDLDFELSIVGRQREPHTLAEAREILRAAGIEEHVRFLGEEADVTPHLAAADLLVHPSHTEAFPRVLVEAMNLALPCVATDAGGSREAVEDGVNGRIVPVGEADALARALGEVLTDPGIHGPMARAALDRYRRCFTPQATGRALTALLEEAAGLAPVLPFPRSAARSEQAVASDARGIGGGR